MPTFRYNTPASGAALIDAPDQGAAVRELLARGVMPVAIEPADAAAPGSASLPWPARSAMGRAETASFISELATALSAGLPLVTSLRTIAAQGRTQAQKRMLARLIADVEGGSSLADAAEAIGPPFTELIVNLMRAGEASGRLDEVLMQGAELLDRDVALRRSILGALVYPMILGVLIVVAIIIVTTVIVPSILAQTPIPPSELPVPTRIVRMFAMIVSGWWWILLPALLACALLAMRLHRAPEVRIRVDRAILRVPLAGPLIRLIAALRFTRTLATLTGAGLGVIPSLTIAKGTLANRAMEHAVEAIQYDVAHGASLAEPMERAGMFPPMLVQVVSLGETSGRLPEMLRQCAHALEARAESGVKLLTTALPPILVVIMAVLVAFIVLAILLPLLQLGNTIMQGGPL